MMAVHQTNHLHGRMMAVMGFICICKCRASQEQLVRRETMETSDVVGQRDNQDLKDSRAWTEEL